MSATSKPDFILFAGQDWWYHNRSHSDFQLMIQAAETRKVIIVNSIAMRMPIPGRSSGAMKRIFNKLKSLMRAAQKPIDELPNLTIVTPFFLPFYGSKLVRKLNGAVLRFQLRRLMKREGISMPHIMVTMPTAWDVVRSMPKASLIYNRSDRHSEFPEADTQLIEELEQGLLDNADLVVFSSHQLLNEERGRVKKRAEFLDHGIDLERFHAAASHQPDPRLADLPRPIVGFFGNFRDYVVDLGLLKRVAQELPDHTLALIGPTTVPLDDLTDLPNVQYLGKVPYDEIPRLGRHFDVAIMPWKQNDWIKACNPIKLKEYLALDRRIVSTWFPELGRFDGMVAVAQNGDEFIELIRSAAAQAGEPLADDGRRQLLLDSTWAKKCQELFQLADSCQSS